MAKVEAEVKKPNKGEEVREFFKNIAEKLNELKKGDIYLQCNSKSNQICLIATADGKSAIVTMTRKEADELGILIGYGSEKIHDVDIGVRYRRTKEGAASSKKAEIAVNLGKNSKGVDIYDKREDKVYEPMPHIVTEEHIKNSINDIWNKIHTHIPYDTGTKTFGA